jgi:hypothetical protein
LISVLSQIVVVVVIDLVVAGAWSGSSVIPAGTVRKSARGSNKQYTGIEILCRPLSACSFGAAISMSLLLVATSNGWSNHNEIHNGIIIDNVPNEGWQSILPSFAQVWRYKAAHI